MPFICKLHANIRTCAYERTSGVLTHWEGKKGTRSGISCGLILLTSVSYYQVARERERERERERKRDLQCCCCVLSDRLHRRERCRQAILVFIGLRKFRLSVLSTNSKGEERDFVGIILCIPQLLMELA